MSLDWSHAEFRFRSQRTWQRIDEDATHMQLFCPETRTSLMLGLVGQGTPPEEQENAARVLMEERRRLHLEAVTQAPPDGRPPALSYDYERLQPHPSGNGFEVVYEGVHADYSVFGFLGYVTTRKVFSLFVETSMTYVIGHRSMFREVVSGFQVTLP